MRTPPRKDAASAPRPSAASGASGPAAAPGSRPEAQRQRGQALLEALRQAPLDPEPVLGVSQKALAPLEGALLEAAIRALTRD
jgi:hypothetical protein